MNRNTKSATLLVTTIAGMLSLAATTSVMAQRGGFRSADEQTNTPVAAEDASGENKPRHRGEPIRTKPVEAAQVVRESNEAQIRPRFQDAQGNNNQRNDRGNNMRAEIVRQQNARETEALRQRQMEDQQGRQNREVAERNAAAQRLTMQRGNTDRARIIDNDSTNERQSFAGNGRVDGRNDRNNRNDRNDDNNANERNGRPGFLDTNRPDDRNDRNGRDGSNDRNGRDNNRDDRNGRDNYGDRGNNRDNNRLRPGQEQQQRQWQDQQQRQANDYRRHIDNRQSTALRIVQALRQNNRNEQYRSQQRYYDRMNQQRRHYDNNRYDYYRGSYNYSPVIYRYSRGGSYYYANRYQADLMRQAINYGYQEGREAGRADRMDRWGYNYRDAYAYQDANYGYDGYYVDQSTYNYYFRQGFQRGYEDAYYNRYRYGRQYNNGYSLNDSVFRLILNFSNWNH